MKNTIVLTAILSAMYGVSSFADESLKAEVEKPSAEATAVSGKAPETKEPEPPWDLSFTLNFVSDYRARGISQTWLAPAVQGSIDLKHESGFYTGVWASNVSDESTAGAREGAIQNHVK